MCVSNLLAPKAGVQAGLGREVNCLKDQVDILRESSYSYNRHEQVLSRNILETDPRHTMYKDNQNTFAEEIPETQLMHTI